MASSEEKRAQRMARFDETVAGIDDRSGQRQDSSRAGGRRKLDVSEETVSSMARRNTTPLDEAILAKERMSRTPWSELPRHQRTIGSAHQFDWFDRAEPFERYEITNAAAREAGVGSAYTRYAEAERAGRAPSLEEVDAHNRMRLVRDEMLATDPRSDAEMRERGARTRQELDRRAAVARELRSMTETVPAVRSNRIMSGARVLGETAGRWMGRLAWPLAAAGAVTAVADEAEGSSLLNKANAAVRGGFGLDVINANRVLGQRLGLVRPPDDNTI